MNFHCDFMLDIIFPVSWERPQERLYFKLFQVMHLKCTAQSLGSRLWHVIHCKQNEEKISWQFISFINASAIPKKSQAKRLRVGKTTTMRPFFWSNTSQGTRLNLDRFHFLPQILVSNLIFHLSQCDYVHVWSQNPFFMARNPPQNIYFGREPVSGMWHIKSWYSDFKHIINRSPSHSQSDQQVGETVSRTAEEPQSCKVSGRVNFTCW